MNSTREDMTPLATDAILTPAETRIASGYVAGYIGKEIASACDISYNTVVKHTQNIYDKAGCRRSTNALVAWFLSVNARLDLREFERRIGAFVLLCILSLQMAAEPAGDNYVRRTSSRRMEARKGGRRTKRDELDITTL